MKKFLSLPPFSLALEAVELYNRVGVSRSAAALAYFLTLTLFPLLLCVNYLLGQFHLDLEELLVSLDQFLPPGVLPILEEYLLYVSQMHSPALLWAGLFTIVVSASAGLRTLFHTMDALHGVERPHPILRFVLSFVLSLLFLLTVYLSVVVIFTGEWFFSLLRDNLPNTLIQFLPLDALSGLWRWMRYLLLFCFVLLLVLLVYRTGTPRGAVRRRFILLSSLLASLAIVAASVLFSWFIGMSSRYALVYGSLASLIILLAWLYLCGSILLLGAVAGRVLENRLGRRASPSHQKKGRP